MIGVVVNQVVEVVVWDVAVLVQVAVKDFVVEIARGLVRVVVYQVVVVVPIPIINVYIDT